MASSFFRFLWIAFREYWGVWVTGTGLVGLLLFLLNLTQNVTGWKMKPRHYLIVLFCVFWFLATFSAWHDADKNLAIVIQQRAQDVSKLGICQADLKTKSALLDDGKEQYTRQQTNFGSLQSSLNSQQQTINSCVVSLGKMNPRLHEHIAVVPILLFTMDPTNGRLVGMFAPRSVYADELIITTNEIEDHLHGNLRCDKPFTPIESPHIPASSQTVFTATAAPNRISDREYEISVTESGTEWGPNAPAYLRVTTEDKDIGKCEFAPQ